MSDIETRESTENGVFHNKPLVSIAETDGFRAQLKTHRGALSTFRKTQLTNKYYKTKINLQN